MVGQFGDEVMTATLLHDTWRTRHDCLKVVMVNIANEARVPIDCEVFGLFRDLIPAQLMEMDESGKNGHQPNSSLSFNQTLNENMTDSLQICLLADARCLYKQVPGQL